MWKRILIILFLLIMFIFLFHPGRHAKYYDYIQINDVIDELVPTEFQIKETNLKECSKYFYKDLILSEEEFSIKDIYKFKNFTLPRNGGEYIPKDCYSIFKVAIIVPYRNRPSQLNIFLPYFHSFLQHQKIHYQIFVVDQYDNLPFNRAKMLNVGANEAMKMKFPCLILHDVDLFPLNFQNIYACCRRPRHMSSSIDIFRYNLPYIGLSGGAMAIQSRHFKEINGMSNRFYGWGGEDDDFFKRLQAHDLTPYRFAPEISRYTMLAHKKDVASNDRWQQLEYSLDRQAVDGLNTIPNNYKVIFEQLYTHIIV